MPDPTPPLDLDAIQRALEHLMWLANTERGKSPEAVLTAFSLARQAGLLVERVRGLEAEVAEATAIMQRVSERQFACWQAVQRAVGESHRFDDATREMRIWLDDRAPAWLAARARFTADDA